MIVVLYEPTRQFARFYSGFSSTTPLELANRADRFNTYRHIECAKLVQPPLTGKGYCVDCVRPFDVEDIGLMHQGHFVDIRDIHFNMVEERRDA